MAQFARPALDVTRVDMTEGDGTTVALFDQINEGAADDLTFITSIIEPTASIYVFKWSGGTDPVSSSNHVVRYHYKKDAAGGDAIDLLVELRQGYVSEGAQGTLIADAPHADIPGDAWTLGTLTLDAGEADAITNYNDLYLRVVFSTA